MNDLDLCLEVISRSRQPLRYHWRWIARKPLKIEAWFQRTTNRKWYMSYRDDVAWPWKVKLVTPIRLERNISKTTVLELETSNLVCSFLSGMPSGRTNNFPESGRGLGHVTPTIFGSTASLLVSISCVVYTKSTRLGLIFAATNIMD